MALDQSALLELLEALKVADADGVVRQALESHCACSTAVPSATHALVVSSSDPAASTTA